MSIEAISIPPQNQKKPEYLVILLHGWGANYHDLASLAPMFNLPNYQFLFPNAPFNHPQVPGGRAWYSLDTNNYDGIEESCQLLFDWLSSLPQNTGIPMEKIFVGGFSQGGAMSLNIGLLLPVAGVFALSGYLQDEPQKQVESFPPVLICHGTLDPVVPLNLAQQAKDKLESVGVKVQYHEFNIAHEIIPEEINIVSKFFKENAS